MELKGAFGFVLAHPRDANRDYKCNNVDAHLSIYFIDNSKYYRHLSLVQLFCFLIYGPLEIWKVVWKNQGW